MVCEYLYYRWRSSSQIGRIGISCICLPRHVCVPVPSQDWDLQRHMPCCFLCLVDQDEMSVRVVDIDVTVHVSSQDLDFQRHMPWSIIRIVDIESIKDQHCLNFHDIGKILLKVALNTKKSNQSSVLTFFSIISNNVVITCLKP